MTHRSARLTAGSGAAVVLLAATAFGANATAGNDADGGWAVDTEDCPDPDAVNAPIEGEIVIGSAMPLSGGVAAAAFEPAARGFEAYIAYANEQDLLPGVEIVAEIGDDQYNPSLTPGVVQGLIDDGAHLFSGIIGTPGNLVVRDLLNEECIPQLNALSGDPVWGEEIEDYPWTTGLLTSYELESRGYAASISEQFPDATVGLYYINNEFGQVYIDAFREAADEAGVEIVVEQTVEVGDESPPQAQLASLRDAAPDVIMATPLGAQCVTFLNELGTVKQENPDWTPEVYLTNTCASSLILGAAGANADGLYTSAAMGLRDVSNPEVAESEAVAEYLFVMRAEGLGDIITTGGAGWNAAEVTVQILVDAADSADGLTQASIINAARNLEFSPSLLRDGMTYIMNGEEDGYYSEQIQIVRYDASAGHFNDIGEMYDYETSADGE